MKSHFKSISLADLCSWFGVTRQAYYQNKKKAIRSSIVEEVLIQEVLNIRQLHPRMGGRKLFHVLQPFIIEHRLKIGRDAFFTILNNYNLLVKRRKRYHVTTNSNHWMRKYPNLIKEIVPLKPNHIWVSDITYWKTKNKHLYISFITDAFSRKIVGYQVAETMEAVESVKALKMALKTLPTDVQGLLHHSDRGSQYCSSKYVKLLRKNKVAISMTENGDPLENSIAERINGIIKGEYLFNYKINRLKEARQTLSSVVKLYNNKRPHTSINYLTPNEVHQSKRDIEIKRLWKNYYTRKEKKEVLISNEMSTYFRTKY